MFGFVTRTIINIGRLWCDPSRLLSYYLIVCSSLLASYAFGSACVYELLTVSSFVALALLNYLHGNFMSFLLSVALMALSIFEPSILRCTSLIAVLFGFSCYAEIGSSILLCSLFVSSFSLFRTCLVESLLSPWSLLILSLTTILILRRVSVRSRVFVFRASCVAYGVSLLLWAGFGCKFGACKIDNEQPGYGIGKSLSLILNEDLAQTATLYYLNDSTTVVTNSGCVYLDHDSKTIYEKATFEQSAPWSSNELVASEPLRVALCHDGALISNIGTELNPACVQTLWGQYRGGKYHILGGFDNRLVVGDSDIVGDMLAPYQYHFIRRIGGKDVCYRLWLFFIAMILIAQSCVRAKRLLQWLTLVAMMIFVFVFPCSNCHGGVRYEGRKMIYPHTELGYGVIRSMQKQGHCCLFTRDNASVLVVSESRCAKHENENTIILEPRACVYVGEDRFEADSVPFGVQNGVIDARQIMKNGKVVSAGRFCEAGVTIYATGSPARLIVDE